MASALASYTHKDTIIPLKFNAYQVVQVFIFFNFWYTLMNQCRARDEPCKTKRQRVKRLSKWAWGRAQVGLFYRGGILSNDLRVAGKFRSLTRCFLYSGNNFFASSSLTAGWTITWSPFFQLTGVVILCLSPSWSESTTRRTSSNERPVWAG